MVGYKFMGKAHAHAWRDLPFYFDVPVQPVLAAVSGRDEAALQQAADVMGFASIETDWHALVERDDIDVVDIVTPNNLHAEIAVAAAKAGKHVICEKPLAMTVAEAETMLHAVKTAGVSNLLCHNYRFAPAVQLAKRLIASGRLGRIFHFRAQYLQDWIMDPAAPMVWRLRKDVTGSGALGDIGAHIIDLARFLVGEFHSVSGMLHTFVEERPGGHVDVDDATAFLARFENGAMGVFEATRFAGGNRNGNRFEVNGEKGSIRWNLEDMNWLEVYFQEDEPGLQGFRRIHCTEEEHPYAGAYWPSGHIIGYEHTFINLFKSFVDGFGQGTPTSPDFEDGLRNQKVLAAVEQSAAQQSWIRLS